MTRVWRALRAGTGGVSTVAAGIAAAAVLVMTIGIVVDVAGRTWTGRGVPGMIEYISIILVIAVFLGMGQAQRQGDHVSVTLVVRRLPPQLAGWMRSVGLILAIGFLAWMALESGQRALASYRGGEYRFGLVRVPVWPARAAVPVGLVILIVELAWSLADAVRQAMGRFDPFAEDLLAQADRGEVTDVRGGGV